MNDLQRLNDEFYERCYSMDYDAVIEMNAHIENPTFNNVVVGLNDECFTLALLKESEEIVYQLVYVNGRKVLTGMVLELTPENPYRDDLVFKFSNLLAVKYDLDTIDVFNTFQQYTRSMLETLGYFTVTNIEMEKFKGQDPVLIVKAKKTSLIPLIDKVVFFREYFGNRHELLIEENKDYVYLMLNKRNGLIKIGRSIKPKVREKTLQGEEPEIFIISIWAAPKEVERELHRTFRDKRKRGEWFKLQSKEMRELKNKMSEF